MGHSLATRKSACAEVEARRIAETRIATFCFTFGIGFIERLASLIIELRRFPSANVTNIQGSAMRGGRHFVNLNVGEGETCAIKDVLSSRA
jgi:hypothetical protein